MAYSNKHLFLLMISQDGWVTFLILAELPYTWGPLAETTVPTQLCCMQLILQQASLGLFLFQRQRNERESKNVLVLLQAFACILFVNIPLTTVNLIAEPRVFKGWTESPTHSG